MGVVLAVALGAVTGPFPASLGDGASGDPELSSALADAAGPGRVGLAAAVVTPDGARTAAVGDDGNGDPLTADTPMEVGSVTKTFTGAVLADLSARGVLRPDERVRDLVPDRPWRPGGAGDATLEELAGHRSGLPVEPRSAAVTAGNIANGLFGWQPYRSDADGVLATADAMPLQTRGSWSYSNLGTALLGHAMAVRAGVPYPELLASSVTGPLGMGRTGPPAAEPPEGAAAGHDDKGRPAEDWVDPGDAPAGAGMFSTATDMAAYARAVLTGWPPATEAAVPRAPASNGMRIGYAWYSLELRDRTLLLHDGQSGGMSSTIVVDRERGQAVVVLGNTTRQVGDVAFALAGMPSPPRGEVSAALASPVDTLIGILAPLLAGASLLVAARGGVRRRGPVRRPQVVGSAAGSLFLFAIAVAYGATTWLVAPFWLAGCALAGAGGAVAVTSWASMDPDRGPVGRLRWAAAVAGLVIGAGTAVGVSGLLT